MPRPLWAPRLDLSFNAERHEYRAGDRVVPGVTSILRPLSSFDHVPPDVLAAKADLGRRVHLACELNDEDDLDESTVEPDVAGYLSAWRRFRMDTGCAVIAVEQRVFDSTFWFAGTLDRVLAFKGDKWLTDLKTSFVTPQAAGPQTAAYLRALADVSVTRRAALRLRPDGTYRFDRLEEPNDWAVFMACLALRNFHEAHK